MSWLFSLVLVEEYLGENCLDGEPSAPLSGNLTPQAYCAPDKMTAFSRLSRFGMTFKPLTEDRGKELLTLYRAGFPVKTSVPPGGGQELQEPDQECGHTWQGSLAKYDPSTHLWKTAQCSLFVDLEQFLEIFPKSGMTVNGLLWELPMLEQTIRGTESGSWQNKWATPTTMDTLPPKSAQALHKEATQARLGRSKPANLRDQVSNMDKWPTPQSRDYKGSSGRSLKGMEMDLPTKVKMWPTPVTRDYKDTGTKESMTRALNKRDSPGLALMVGAATGGQLNPTWVEWLMGWPLGWTDLRPLVTDKSPCAPPPPGKL